MFITLFSNQIQKVKRSCLGIVSSKCKTAEEIMDVIKAFFSAKSVQLEKLLSKCRIKQIWYVIKKTGLQRKIRFYSFFNNYSCGNCPLASCVPHLMRDNSAELLWDYNSFLLGFWKMLHFSPRKGTILKKNIQTIYEKKTFKIFKTAVTH